MDMLVQETLKYGFVPPVVMEFPGITVGGGIQGGAGESSSFKYGGFHQTCLEYEMVLGDGTIVTVSPRKNADLFWGTACSYGSLGVITKVKLRIIPAKKYVLLTYHRVNTFGESIKLLEKEGKEKTSIDFIDGILFSEKSGTIMTGYLAIKKIYLLLLFQKQQMIGSTLTRKKSQINMQHGKNLSQLKIISSDTIEADSGWAPMRLKKCNYLLIE